MPTIKVSNELKEKLDDFKIKYGCKSYNEVINLLFKDHELYEHLKKQYESK